MTSEPERGAQAIAYLEHDTYRMHLANAAAVLEMGFATEIDTTGNQSVRMFWLWRNHEDRKSRPADFVTRNEEAAAAFLHGVAIAVQGDWAP